MPIAIDTTIGGAAANSYVTEEEFITFAAERLNAGSFASADEEDRRRALLMAAKDIDRLNWRGIRVSRTQALAHPRYQLRKVDSIDSIFDNYSHQDYTYQNYYLPTEIAQPVKDAQMVYALRLLDGFRKDEQDLIESFTSDGVSIRFREASTGARDLPAEVEELLDPLIQANRIRRS